MIAAGVKGQLVMPELQEQLIAIERKLWSNDAAFYEAALVDDALLVFAETGAITRDVAVSEIERENLEGRRWEEVDFEDVRCVRIAPQTALLAYRVRSRWAHEASGTSSFASSVYVERGGEWKLAFHQQTPTAVSPDVTAIRMLIEKWAAAVRAKDRVGILAHHAPDIVMFDVPPPLASKGIESYEKTWSVFFAWAREPVMFNIEELNITAGDDVAFATALMRCAGTEDGELEFRLTVGLRKIDGQWLITHEHHSIPAA